MIYLLETREYFWKNSRYPSKIDYALISAPTYQKVQSIEYFTPQYTQTPKDLKCLYVLKNLTDLVFVQKIIENIDKALNNHCIQVTEDVPSSTPQ